MMVRLTNSRPYKSAREVALDYLSRRALSHRELKTRLEEKGYPAAEINEVLKKMEEYGYINDQELALTVCQNRLKRYSRRRVHRDLQNRGFVPEVIEKALQATYSSDDEFEQCLTLAKCWWIQEDKRWERRCQDKAAKNSVSRQLWMQQQVVRKLVYRGYPSEIVRNVIYHLKTIMYGDDESI